MCGVGDENLRWLDMGEVGRDETETWYDSFEAWRAALA